MLFRERPIHDAFARQLHALTVVVGGLVNPHSPIQRRHLTSLADGSVTRQPKP